MELNASGLSKACEEMFPSRRMLEEAMKLGIPLTLGSDAHQPMKLGEHLDQARALLSELGVREVATFRNRKREMVLLNVEETMYNKRKALIANRFIADGCFLLLETLHRRG